MAMPSNKSSSPSMVAGRTSPNSRNSEVGNPVRRSFSGNPFAKPSIVANPRSFNPVTPANSPSDYPRRNSVSSRQNLFTPRDNEEKENGKDQNPKPIGVRSPTVGKSSKHFMSPTISAASKIAVSPKKRILGDRNESVRSSLSFSGMKTSSLNSVNPNSEAAAVVESDTNPETVSISNSSIGAPTPKSSRTVRFANCEVISGSYDSKSTCDLNPEVVTVSVETDMKPEIAPISSSAIAAAPTKTKTVRFSGVEVLSVSNNESPVKNIFTEELDCVNLDPSFTISPDSSPMVAPLDADSLIPPYDPKTNYLSPRPQFLHYRPNRRIERGNKLEELFSSVNVSESEFIEETESEDSLKEYDESQEVEEEVEEEEEEHLHISEQDTIKVKGSTKSLFSRIFKISSLLLILSITCLSICAVVHDPNILERSVEDPSEIYEFAKTNFNVLVGKLEIWHENSISSFSHVISNLRGAPSLIYLNQTELLYKDVNMDGQCLVLSPKKENNLNVIEEATQEKETDIQSIEKEDQTEEEGEWLQEIEAMNEMEAKNEEVVEEEELLQEIEAKANYPKDGKENDKVFAKSASEEPVQEIETNDPQDNEENDEISAKSASDKIDEENAEENETEEIYEVSAADFETLDQIESEAATGQTEEKHNDSLQQQSNIEIQNQSPPISPSVDLQSDVESSNVENIEEVIGAATDRGISVDFTQNMAVMSALLLGLSLLIPAGLIYARKSGSKPSMAAVEEQKQHTNQTPVEKEEVADEQDDMAGESCSSEMSSFQYSSMGGAGAVKGSSEAQSHSRGRKTRKNSRRESMASSSLDDDYSISASPSPSYGSFTSYERIPIKHHGNGEEETMTPVRRSSRIRKQHNNS